MTVRGGGVPLSPMAAMPALRMGPPPRSFAADAHACIMVWVTTTHRIQGCGADPSCRDSELPSNTSSRPHGACRQRRAMADLDSPCARRPPTHVGRGEETGFQVEQRNWYQGSGECREIVLDFESPIQGREARRPASHAADQVRVGYQPANREAAPNLGDRVVGGSNTIEWPRIVLPATQRNNPTNAQGTASDWIHCPKRRSAMTAEARTGTDAPHV